MQRKVLPVGEVEQELDLKFNDWRTFPVYRNVGSCNLNEFTFLYKGEPAEGDFFTKASDRIHRFHLGQWISSRMLWE